MNRWWLAPLLITLLFTGIRLTLPADVFWSSDEGNKFIQVQSLAYSDASTLAVPFPGAGIDPSFRYFPDGGNHFLRLNGRIYSFYPFYFPLMTLPWFRWFGIAGLYILPLLGLLVCLLTTDRLLQRLGLVKFRGVALLVFALCTPFFFYTLTFWEHTVAAALSTAALLCLVRKEDAAGIGAWLAAGVLVGLSTILREEGYVFFAAFLLAALFVFRNPRRAAAFAAGWVVVLIPVWLLQKSIFGHYMGSHAILYRSPIMEVLSGNWKAMPEVLSNYYIYLLEFHQNKLLNLLLAIPFLGVLALSLANPGSTIRVRGTPWVLLLACGSAAFLAFSLATNPAPMRNTLFTQGFLPGAPFVLLAFLCGYPVLKAGSGNERFLFLLLLLYIGGTCVNLNQKYFGIIWGPRHFLPVFPILIAFAWKWLQDPEASAGRLSRAPAVLLLVISFFIQGFGALLLSWKLQASTEFVNAVEAAPQDVVVTDAFWVPEDLSALFFRKRILMVRSDAELADLIDLLKSRGVEQFLFARSRYYHMLSQQGLKLILDRALSEKVQIHPRLMLDTALYECSVEMQPARR